jgi:site-specific DNA-methyltransferase (adenine-specific)/site-specific DNA-methyltransferase (cytosine-N4-specific)
MPDTRILRGDCLEVLPTLAEASADCVVTDPPYPCIERDYGTLTEAQWHALMDGVVSEVRRVLKPKGSAVFVLQANSRRLGEMRLWLWEWLVRAARSWNLIQDAYWWNDSATPEAHAIQGRLMRPSLKFCVWLGPADCYRDQDAILGEPSERMRSRMRRARREDISGRVGVTSGHGMDQARACAAVERRGGVTPFNVQATGIGHGQRSAGAHGHPAGTPLAVCERWVKYLCPPGGTVLDPFAGAGTVGAAAVRNGRNYVGIERHAEYCDLARERIAAAQPGPTL